MAPGTWRLSLSAARGTVRSSHVATCPEVAPECASIAIPAHEHHVAVGLTHTELGVEYGLRRSMQLTLRLPYDVKESRVRYTTLGGAPFTPPYGDIHHRTETLRGISDPSVTVDYAVSDFIIGAGLTLPLGRIEPDPIRAGAEGRTHEHLQFGSGTFQPRLTAQYAHGWLLAHAEGTLSLHRNREGFSPPATVAWAVGPAFRTFHVLLDGQYQSQGRWHGVIDEDSGFHDGGVRVQLSLPFHGAVIAPSLRRQLWSHSLSAEQSFRQRWTAGLTVTVRP